MKNIQNLKSFKPLRFVVVLPPELSELFLAEMKIQDRKKLPLARYIIATYFRERALRKEFDEFIQLRAARGDRVPHFGDELLPPDASALGKGTR